MTALVCVLMVLASTVAVCVVFGRMSRAATLRDWELLLGPRQSSHIDAFEKACQLDGWMADDSWQGASKAFHEGDLGEAIRLLELSFQVLEAATHERRVRMRAVTVCVHMAAALAPPPPLMPREFRLRQVRTLAGAAHLVQHVLVGGRERLAFHARVIAFAFRLTMAALRRAKRLDVAEALRRFDVAKGDWKTLDKAHVEAVRTLIVSLEAVRRERVFVAPL